jgi:hypothetical protein
MTINRNTAVKAGAALLDERQPGWYLEIDLPTLRVASCDTCILGQVFGSYLKGTNILGLTDSGPSEHGFDQAIEVGVSMNPAEQFEILDKLWKQEVRRRTRADERIAAKQLVEA